MTVGCFWEEMIWLTFCLRADVPATKRKTSLRIPIQTIRNAHPKG